MEGPLLVALTPLVFGVAFLYSSVGHGGASGYLALLSLFGAPSTAIASTALLLNVLVAGVAWWNYGRAGHSRWRLLLSFVLTSVPAAFFGGWLKVSGAVYSWALAAVLAAAAARFFLHLPSALQEPVKAPSLWAASTTGSGIGFLSGMVGVGGGIFLSPLALLLRWSTVKETSALSAGFIVVNSVAGLVGRGVGGTLEMGVLLWLVPAAFAGGLLGSSLGSRRFSGPLLRRLLGVVLLVASGKLAFTSLSG